MISAGFYCTSHLHSSEATGSARGSFIPGSWRASFLAKPKGIPYEC